MSSTSLAAVLDLARKAGVSVTVDCQCDGIFIDGRYQYSPGEGFISDAGAPTHIAPDVLAALLEHARELEPMLKAAGWWSCGCERPVDEDEDELPLGWDEEAFIPPGGHA